MDLAHYVVPDDLPQDTRRALSAIALVALSLRDIEQRATSDQWDLIGREAERTLRMARHKIEMLGRLIEESDAS